MTVAIRSSVVAFGDSCGVVVKSERCGFHGPVVPWEIDGEFVGDVASGAGVEWSSIVQYGR